MMNWTIILAENAREAKEVANKQGLGYWQYQYIFSPSMLSMLKPEFTDVIFAPNWHRHDKSAVIFEKAFGLGLIK